MAMESNTAQRLDTLQVGFFSFRRCLHHGEQSAESIGAGGILRAFTGSFVKPVLNKDSAFWRLIDRKPGML